MRLQILTTEHWSLLSTRRLSWNEAFSRAAMFLSALSGAVVALALVAQATSFGEGFVTFALLILPVVLFLGVAMFVRLVEINHEDVLWVAGMNMMRHAYLEAAPELRPYFITGWHDDEAGMMAIFGARVGPGAFAHEFITAPGVLAVIDGVLAGVLIGIAGLQLGTGTSITLGCAVAVGLLTIALLAVYQYRGAVRPRARRRARFPDDAATISDPRHRPDLGAVGDRLAGTLPVRSALRLSCGGVAEWTNAAVLKLAAIDVSASDRTFATLQTAARSRCWPVYATA